MLCLKRTRRRTRFGLLLTLTLTLTLAWVFSLKALSAETRGFVLTHFHIATHLEERNCPNGGNGGLGEVRERALKIRGFSRAKIDELLAGKGVGNVAEKFLRMYERGIRNGKPANIHHYPESQADPQLEMVSGAYAYGFDLDGKGPGIPGTFKDPDTHQQGRGLIWMA